MVASKTLRSELPNGRVVTDPDVLSGYSRDMAALAIGGVPSAAVIASSIDDVQATLGFASSERIPVVTRGAGSGLAGGANAIDGCIVLVTTSMNTIVDVDASNLIATVQPGVINTDLKDEVRKAGLFYPPDPASSGFSTLGGNVATNAGGLCCVKYGVTGDYVAALDVVLSDGSLIRTGSRTRKSVAGYDLTSLIVGSEGTLGVVVGATLRVIPVPDVASTVIAEFDSLSQVGRIPEMLAASGITPSMLEVLDRHTLAAVESHTPMGLDSEIAALVIAQSDSKTSGTDAEAIAKVAQRLGASQVYVSADPVEAEMLLQARRLAYTALESQPGRAVLDDVAVPVEQITPLIDEIDLIAKRIGLTVATFGHLGDGNLHPTIIYNPQTEGEQKAKDVFDAIVEIALELGGTVTGEHGVGNLKRGHFGRQFDQTTLLAHRAVKEAFDPNNILNPGKGLPVAPESG